MIDTGKDEKTFLKYIAYDFRNNLNWLPFQNYSGIVSGIFTPNSFCMHFTIQCSVTEDLFFTLMK